MAVKTNNKFQLHAHDVRNILSDIWESNDIKQKHTVNGITKEISLKKYLNVELFAFRNELKSVGDSKSFGDYNEWLEAAFKSIDKSFARCNIISEENTIATDIDFAAFQIDYEIIIQPEKLEALEVYWNNLRKTMLGSTYPMTLIDGRTAPLFITMGNLVIQDGIDTSQVGKSIILTATIAITCLVGGLTYNDYEYRVLFEDDPTGKWYKLNFTNLTRAMVNTGDKVITQAKPQHIGHLPQMSGLVMNIVLYDMFNRSANKYFNDISLKAISMGERSVKDPTDIDNIEIPDVDELLNMFTEITDYEPPKIYMRIWNKRTRKEYIMVTYPVSIEQTTINGSYSALSVSLSLDARNVDYIEEVT